LTAAPRQHRRQVAILKRSVDNAEHYGWGENCDGWILAPSPDLMVIEERMLPGTGERRHVHAVARQFFYTLSSELTMELDGVDHRITPGSGIEIPPGAGHQARNDGTGDVRFLVVSSPSTRGDRLDL